MAHMCRVREGKCLRRDVRPGFLADPAVLSSPHCPPPPSSSPGSTPSSCRSHPAWLSASPRVPSSGELEFNLFFPYGPSQTSATGPRPTAARIQDIPGTLSLLPHESPLLGGTGKSCHKPCPHPHAPCLSPKPSCQLLRSQPTPTERHPTLWVGSRLQTGQAAGWATCLRRDQMEGLEEGQGWGRL